MPRASDAEVRRCIWAGVTLIVAGAALPPLPAIRAACMSLTGKAECGCTAETACRAAIGAASLGGGRA